MKENKWHEYLQPVHVITFALIFIPLITVIITFIYWVDLQPTKHYSNEEVYQEILYKGYNIVEGSVIWT